MRPVVLFGGGGLLGRALVPVLEERGYSATAPPSSQADVTRADDVREAVARAAAPAWVVNLAAYTDVDGAEVRSDRAFAVNRDGAAHVAGAAREVGARLLHLSTDYVFDGRAARPYPPDAPTSPLNAYGQSKLEGEEAVREAGLPALIVRTSWLYGSGRPNFVDAVLERGREGGHVEVVADQWGRPTWARSLARMLVELMDRELEGTYHATDGGEASWWELAFEAFRLARVRPPPAAVPSSRLSRPAPRPAYSVLDISATEGVLGTEAPHWKESLRTYLKEEK